MRIATFNVESLDLPPKTSAALDDRAAILRPQLERLRAGETPLRINRPDRYLVLGFHSPIPSGMAGWREVAAGPAPAPNISIGPKV